MCILVAAKTNIAGRLSLIGLYCDCDSKALESKLDPVAQSIVSLMKLLVKDM